MVHHLRHRLVASLALIVIASAVTAGCTGQAGGLGALKASAPTGGPDCHPSVDPTTTHYVIGYGSLMQQASRTSTAPAATIALPIEVSGFRRGFIAAGQQPGFNTVYLGVVPDAQSRFNAVLFDVPASQMTALDKREGIYCRVAVPASAVTILGDQGAAPEGQAWIYVNKADSLGLPSADIPIIQSYVDIFLSGCLELQDANQLTGFADECVTSTTDWSTHWVNDRIFPRMPQDRQPQAKRIDVLLQQHVPDEFSAIRIE